VKPLFDLNILRTAGAIKLPFECEYCHSTFHIAAKEVRREIKRKNDCFKFCNRSCFGLYQENKEKVVCANCNLEIFRIPSHIRKSKSGNSFCSSSCAATYHNTHKTTGIRRSKLEIWIEEKLRSDYRDIEILFNNKDVINSELDIYFPNIKLGVELNGIFHYEPIYGKDKLSMIKNNDNRKFQACLERDIELIIIDASKMKNFNITEAEKYYSIINSVLNTKI
jgi:hypothetical protein